jgi:hypothetical protein
LYDKLWQLLNNELKKYVKGNALIFGTVPEFMWLKPPNNKPHLQQLSIIFNAKPPEYQEELLPAWPPLRWESIIGQFQTLHTLSVKYSHNTAPHTPLPARQPLVGQGLLKVEAWRSQLHTTLGRTPLDEWSARFRDLYVATYNAHRKRTSTRPAGFEPEISARERPQTHARPLGLAFPDIRFNTTLMSSVLPVVSFQVICPPRHCTHLLSDQTYRSSHSWHVRSNSYKHVV